MVAATATPDAFSELCLIGVTSEDDLNTEFEFAGYTEDITFDSGDKDVEGMPLTSGGRIVKPVPMTDESVTFKVYPVTADKTDGGFVQLFNPIDPADTTEPFVVTTTAGRSKHRIIMLWSSDLPAAASAVPQPGAPSYRIQVVNAYMTGYKMNYDDKILSAECTFKWTPFNRAGTGNKREESTTGGTTSSAQLALSTNSATTWTD